MPDRLRFIKLTNRSRLADRYLTVQVKQAPESSLDQGTIFALVEIEGANTSSYKIGQTIINNLARTYFRGESKQPTENFEQALKQVNETLRVAVQSGETDWIDNLNAVLILLIKNKLHLTGVGKNFGWLVRNKKDSEVFEKSWPKATANKAFSAVLTGQIEPGDRLIFASSGLLDITTKPDFRKVVLGQDRLAEVANNFSELIQIKNGQWVNGLVIDLENEETLSNRPLENLPQTIFLDSSGSAKFGIMATRIWRGTQKALTSFGGQAKRMTDNTQSKLKDQLIPKSKKGLDQTKEWSTKTIDQLKSTTLPKVKTQSTNLLSKVKKLLKRQDKTEDQSKDNYKESIPEQGLIGQAVYAIKDYAQEKPEAEQQIKDYQSRKKRSNFLNDFIKNASHSKWRPWAFAGLAIILIVFFGFSLRSISNQRSSEADLAAKNAELTRLQDLLEEAKLARIFNQPDKAASTLDEILTSLDQLDTPEVAESVGELRNLAQAELDQLTDTTRLTDITEVGELSEATSLAGSANNLYLSNTKSVAKLNGAELDVLGTTKNEIVNITTFDELEAGLILTDAPELLKATDSLASIEANDIQAGVANATFFNSIYTLSPAANQVWKYSNSNENFESPVGYISDSSEIPDAIDLAIDGDVFILNSNGTIFKYTSGRRKDFSLSGIPEPNDTIVKPKSIQTSKDQLYIYVLDDNRILKFEKNGQFAAQFVFDSINQLDGFAVDESQNLVFILSNGKLFRSPL